MKTTALHLALAIAFSASAYASEATTGAALPPKMAKAPKRAPDVEHISIGCPEAFVVRSVDGGKAWSYLCRSTQVEISVLKATPDAHARGSVKGDKSAAWRR